MSSQFQQRYADGAVTTAAQQIVQILHAHGLSDVTVALIVNCGEQTINRIRHARVSGRYLEPRLLELFSLMQRSGALHDR